MLLYSIVVFYLHYFIFGRNVFLNNYFCMNKIASIYALREDLDKTY